MKKLSKLVSLMLSVVLCIGMASPAFAVTYYMEDGDVYVENDEEKGVYSYQGEKSADGLTYMNEDEDHKITITQRDSGTATQNTIAVGMGVTKDTIITLDKVNIDVSGDNKAALSITGTGTMNDKTNVTIDLKGENTLKSGKDHAGLELKNGDECSSWDGASVIIQSSTNGSLTAEGAGDAAGIGGGYWDLAGSITIKGNAEVTAKGSEGGAGIGSSMMVSAGDITISEDAKVTATGGSSGAGIGTAWVGTVSNITIIGNAQVTATGGNKGYAGIGGGNEDTTVGDITISGCANVKATGGGGAPDIGAGSKTTVGKVTIENRDGHSYQPQTEPATCMKDGKTVYTCSRCGDSYTEVIHATGSHTPGEAVRENEVEGSYDEVVYCSVCGGEISRERKTTEPLAPPETPDVPGTDIPDPDIPLADGSGPDTPATIADQEVPLAGLVSRQLLVSALYVRAGSPDGEDAEGEYTKALAWAVANGIIDAESDPEEVVTVAILRDVMTRYAKLLNVIFDVDIPGEDDEIVMNCNEILEKFFASQEDKAA